MIKSDIELTSLFKKIFNIINFFIKFFLLIYFLLVIILQIKLIRKYKNLLIIGDGGFGHTFTLLDILRLSGQNTKFLILDFYNHSRQNQNIHMFFKSNKILLYSNLIFEGKKFKFIFGETSTYNKSKIKKITVKFIKKLSKNHLTIYDMNTFYFNFSDLFKKYDHSSFKKFDLKDPLSPWLKYYLYLQHRDDKKNWKNLKNDFLSSLNLNYKQLKILTDNKICCLYLRQKGKKENSESYLRSGGNEEDYKELIFRMNSHNYVIFITGEVDNMKILKNKRLANRIFNYKKFNMSKKKFNIISLLFNEIFIAENGGAHYFGLYSKIFIGINWFPFGYQISKNILFKKIKTKENIYLDYKQINKNYHFKYKLFDGDELINNTGTELVEHVMSKIQ